MFSRAIQTAARASRSFATAASGSGSNTFVANRAATEAHARETTDLWRKISMYVCVPGAIVGGLWVYKVEAEHAAHLEHMAHENGGEMPDRSVYSYMNIRNKPFPWGNEALFFNPKANIAIEAAE